LVFSWTSVSDTWQKVTVPIPGDTSGGINNDTGSGLTIYWSFSGGKFMASDTGAWVAGAYLSVTSAVNDFDSTSNDVYITGVQLEVGSVATDFAHEDIGTTLQKCYRYLEIIGGQSIGAGYTRLGMAGAVTTTQHYGTMQYSPKRVVPSYTTTGTVYANVVAGHGSTGNTFSAGQTGISSMMFVLGGGSSLTLGSAAAVGLYNDGNSTLIISAEL